MSSAVKAPAPYGVAPKTKTSPKVVLATIFAFLAPALYLTVGYLTTDDGRQIYSSLHPVFRVLIGGLITSLSVFLAGYLKRDGLREVGARHTEQLPHEGPRA